MSTNDLTERIARVLAKQNGCDPDKHCDQWVMDWMRKSAAAVMSVVTPVLAEVYDEGYQDVQDDEREHRPWRKSVHPYRQEQTNE